MSSYLEGSVFGESYSFKIKGLDQDHSGTDLPQRTVQAQTAPVSTSEHTD